MQGNFISIFFGVAFVGLFLMGINLYNGLISLRRQVERAWANIDVILKQRFDELPQLIQIIEQYTGYEAGLLKNLAAARATYGQATNINEKIEASHSMSLALKGIAGIAESYPELKSNNNFVQLQNRISQLESTIADRRESYNDAVTNFNTRIEQFPDVFVARALGYQQQQMFKVLESERAPVDLKMNLPKMGA